MLTADLQRLQTGDTLVSFSLEQQSVLYECDGIDFQCLWAHADISQPAKVNSLMLQDF